MMVMEQQKRAALCGGTGGMMYSGTVPPPQSHKVLTIVCTVWGAESFVLE